MCGNGACPDFNSNSQKYVILGLYLTSCNGSRVDINEIQLAPDPMIYLNRLLAKFKLGQTDQQIKERDGDAILTLWICHGKK